MNEIHIWCKLGQDLMTGQHVADRQMNGGTDRDKFSFNFMHHTIGILAQICMCLTVVAVDLEVVVAAAGTTTMAVAAAVMVMTTMIISLSTVHSTSNWSGVVVTHINMGGLS